MLTESAGFARAAACYAAARNRENTMLTRAVALAAVIGLFAGPAAAQKSGGSLKFFHRDRPARMSIPEEATISTVAPMRIVFNKLNLFNSPEKHNQPQLLQP